MHGWWLGDRLRLGRSQLLGDERCGRGGRWLSGHWSCSVGGKIWVLLDDERGHIGDGL
ncbi:uncharacterized protein METZ01_LOCUS335071, partial [marine metagenome]